MYMGWRVAKGRKNGQKWRKYRVGIRPNPKNGKSRKNDKTTYPIEIIVFLDLI